MPLIQRSLVGLVLLALFPGVSRAQERAAPATLLVQPELGTAVVRLHDLLADRRLLDALHSGLPLRVRVRSELWHDGFFDSQRGRAEWRASITYEPLEGAYRILGGESPRMDSPGASLQEARDALNTDIPIDLRPIQPGRYYFITTVEVETLSLSDLEELQRWLRGEVASAVREESDVERAMGRGLERFFVRALGLPVLRFRARSDAFEYRQPDP